jgi:hypothetical protein
MGPDRLIGRRGSISPPEEPTLRAGMEIDLDIADFIEANPQDRATPM